VNLSNDVHYSVLFKEHEQDEKMNKIHKDLKELRYGGAMDEGQDIRTNLICVTNLLLDLIGHMRQLECTNRVARK